MSEGSRTHKGSGGNKDAPEGKWITCTLHYHNLAGALFINQLHQPNEGKSSPFHEFQQHVDVHPPVQPIRQPLPAPTEQEMDFLILIRFIAARVRKTFHELHLLTPSLLFLPANQVSVGYGDKIWGLNMKKMITKSICIYLWTVTDHCFALWCIHTQLQIIGR